MQAELLRALQLAVQYENAELDAAKLQDDAAFHRRDALSALDELRTRLLQEAPAQPPPLFSQMVPTHQRTSISTPVTPGTPGSGSFPAGVTLPANVDEESSSRMSRLFSIRTKPHKRSSISSPTIQNMIVAPKLNWLGPVQAKPERYEMAAEDVHRPENPTIVYGDIKSLILDPATDMRHPALMEDASIVRNASTSTRSSDYSTYSNYTRNSAFSDEKIPVVDEDEESAFPSAADIAAALPPEMAPAPLNVRPRQNRISSNSGGSQFGSALMSPTGTMGPYSPGHSPTALTPDYSPHAFWFPQNSIPAPTPANLPVPMRDRNGTTSSGAPSSHRNSLVRPESITSVPSSSSTATASATLVGRPEKKNNYWGFCKGSWTIREDWHKGLTMQVIPSGMFGESSVWQCKQCYFRGGIYGTKKPFMTDPNVHEDTETGIRYRWIFLAKCHTKIKMVARAGEGGFGCLFCSLNNVHTTVYSGEELLFQHITEEHAAEMSNSLAARAHCIVGRRAEGRESFDINIP
jgi:hypothetical protein